MNIVNYHDLNLDDISFHGRTIQLANARPVWIIGDSLQMPFGTNVSNKKTTIKFELSGIDAFYDFLVSLDDYLEKLHDDLEYVPLLKRYKNLYYFLATVPKRTTVDYIDSSGNLTERIPNPDDIINAFFHLKYIWKRNGYYGLSLLVHRVQFTE